MILLYYLIILAQVVPINGYALGNFDCPLPWISFGENCYRFNPFPMSISFAKSDCASDSAVLLEVIKQDEQDFVQKWFQQNAKNEQQWFTDGILDSGSGGSGTTSVKYIWESSGLEATGQHFWLSLEARKAPGNRIAYMTNGADWGWGMIDDTNVTKPFICQINKEFIYKILTVQRGFDFGENEIDPTMLNHGPEFTVLPDDTIYDAKSSSQAVNFICEADAKPLPTYQWFVTRQLSTQPVNLNDPKITLTNGRLTITQPTDDKHNGLYYCMANNNAGTITSHSVQLGFGYLNDFPKSIRDPVSATAFKGVGIECYPPKSGYITLTYSWFKDSTINYIRTNVKWKAFVSNDGKLYFQFVTKEDNGNYYCMVNAPNPGQEGKTSMPIQLKVVEAVGSDEEPVIVNSFPKSFPSNPLVDQDVRVECVAFGSSVSQMTYSWDRMDGKHLPSSVRFMDYNRVMIIPKIQLASQGVYRCHVSRQLGKSTKNTITINVEALPFFITPIGNQFVDLGSTVKWQCSGMGVPAITYQWYINGTLFNPLNLNPDQRPRFSVSNNLLVISNVQMKDAGMYQCSISNSHGTRFSSAQLKIYYFAPSFSKFPLQSNTYGTLGNSVIFICNPESAPPSLKVWYKDGSHLNPSTVVGSKIYQYPNGNLNISSLTLQDQGMYSCNATNVIGQDSSAGYLTILPTTTIAQPPRDTVVIVNQTSFFTCQVSYNPAVDILYDWWHNNYKIMFIKVRNLGNQVYVFTEPYYRRGEGIYRGGLYIYNTQFFHAGDYKCVVRSTTDEESAVARLTVIGPPGEPAGVSANFQQATNVTISFWPGADHGSPTLNFIVEAKEIALGVWKRVKTDVPGAPNMNTKIKSVITGLNPFTNYAFRVSGVNALGIGESSQESTQIKTLEAPPVTYPLNLRGGGGKVGTLNITWDPVPQPYWYSDIGKVGYKVYWKRSDMDEEQWDMKVISDPTIFMLTVVVGPENYYLQYDLKIRFFNIKGDGPMSPLVHAMSAEDLPKGVPISVRAVYFNATAIIVEWKPVQNTRLVVGGVILGYRINYWIDREEDELQALFTVIKNHTSNGMVIALRENTDYMVNVQVINTAGNGPKSENYRTRTLRAAPMEAPQQVTVRIVNDQSVLLHWRGVYTTIEEEPLEGYIVRYWKRGENIYVATNLDAGKNIRFILSGLEQYVQYEVRIYGYSRGGDGLQSSPTLEFIIGAPDQVIQDSPDKEYIYSNLSSFQPSIFSNKSTCNLLSLLAILYFVLTT